MAITKKIIGANPVKLEVDGKETSASICWIVRTICDDWCNITYTDERGCSVVTLTPLTCEDTTDKVVSGSITTEDRLTVNYEITQKHFDCESSGECNECYCKPLKTWTIPYYIDREYNGYIDFYCEYYHININTNSNTICAKEKRIWHSAITVSDVGKEIKIDSECGEENACYITAHTGNTIIECQSDAGTIVRINFSVTPNEVPSTGGIVTVVCSFKKITTDESCNETIKNGDFSLQKEIQECNLPNDGCCYAHTVNIEIPVSVIRSNIGITNDIKVYYNNAEVSENVKIGVKQNAKRDGKCSGGGSTSNCSDFSPKIVYSNGGCSDFAPEITYNN